MIETAKANNIVVGKYLIYLFDSLSRIDSKDIERFKHIMSWS